MPFLFGELSLAGRAKLIIRTIQTRGHQDTFVGLSVRHCSSSSRSDKHRIVENWSTGGYICRWGHPFFFVVVVVVVVVVVFCCFFENVPLVEFIYLVFTRTPGGVTVGDSGHGCCVCRAPLFLFVCWSTGAFSASSQPFRWYQDETRQNSFHSQLIKLVTRVDHECMHTSYTHVPER